jgi:hypothetical protein
MTQAQSQEQGGPVLDAVKAVQPPTAKSLGPLPVEAVNAVGQLMRDLPEPKPLGSGEVEGLGRESLDGYRMGSGQRYDSQGRRWRFDREAVDDQWRLTVRVDFFGVPLCDGAVPLDRIAGKEGELQLLALVEWLAQAVTIRQEQVCRAQKAMQREADEAVAALMEQEPAATLIARPATSPDHTDPLDQYPQLAPKQPGPPLSEGPVGQSYGKPAGGRRAGS